MPKGGSAVRTVLLRLLVAAALSGCQATQYQPAAPAGGFGEMQLDGDIWRIRFAHNAFTTRESAQSYWLYRAAELTLSKRYDGFEVLSQTSRVRSYGNDLSRRSDFVIEGEIRMLKKPFESIPPKTYNAEALRAVLGPYVFGVQSASQPAVSASETPPASPDGLRLRMIGSIRCAGSSSSTGQGDCRGEAAPVQDGTRTSSGGKGPEPAAAPLRLQPTFAQEKPPSLNPTGPCQVKPVMTDQDMINCGARPR